MEIEPVNRDTLFETRSLGNTSWDNKGNLPENPALLTSQSPSEDDWPCHAKYGACVVLLARVGGRTFLACACAFDGFLLHYLRVSACQLPRLFVTQVGERQRQPSCSRLWVALLLRLWADVCCFSHPSY